MIPNSTQRRVVRSAPHRQPSRKRVMYTSDTAGVQAQAATIVGHPSLWRDAPPRALTTVVLDAPRDGVRWVLDEMGPSTLVTIHPDTRDIRGRWLDQSCLDEASAWAEAQSKAGFNVFFSANK